MKFSIEYTQGNGYNCGCCRSEYNESIELDTKEEMLDWIGRVKTYKKYPKLDTSGCGGDCKINTIFIHRNIEGLGEGRFKYTLTEEDEKYIEAYTEEFATNEQRKIDDKKEEEAKQRREQELKQLEELKKKYEQKE